METHLTIKNLKINKNKTIGKVIIVVEGQSEEFKLLKHIFVNVLNYNYISIRRGKKEIERFISRENDNCTIIIVNTSSSSIKTIMEDTNYKDKLYELVKKEYNESLKNIPVYIIWDRDNLSNTKKDILKNINTFSSALDNEYDMNGLLLLSYPCVEAYELSNFDNQLWKKTFENSLSAKTKMKSIIPSIHDINEKTLLRAVANMNKTLNMYRVTQYDPSYFKDINLKVFSFEEKKYHLEKLYDALSLISIMFLDLGIIVEK